MCNVITIASVAWLRRAVRRWRARCCSSTSSVPAGHVAVCAQGARFVVRLAHLGHPAFVELLRQAEEEYGFPPGASGPVALPCDEDRLRDVLRCLSSSSDSDDDRRCSFRRRRVGDSRPLLQGVAGEKLVCDVCEAASDPAPDERSNAAPQFCAQRQQRRRKRPRRPCKRRGIQSEAGRAPVPGVIPVIGHVLQGR